MKSMLIVVGAAALFAAGAASAQSGADLVKSKGCTTCHAQDQKKVGPSFNDIAAKHKGNAAAADKLVAQLKDGKGHPKISASDAELKSMVGFVLTGK
jgi:cytochrome c